MQRINSLTDTRGEDFRANARYNRQLAADLKERQQAARFVRPERDLERLRRQNKMFVRDMKPIEWIQPAQETAWLSDHLPYMARLQVG